MIRGKTEKDVARERKKEYSRQTERDTQTVLSNSGKRV